MASARHRDASERSEKSSSTRRRRIGLVLAGVTVVSGAGMIATAVGAGATQPDPQVTLCHAAASKTNPYEPKTIDAAAAVSHVDHTGPVYADGMKSGWGDIIPPFIYDGAAYSLNWPAGMAFLANGCDIPGTTPTTTVTATATQTVTATATQTVTAPAETVTQTVTAPAETVTKTETAPAETVTKTVTETAEPVTKTVTVPVTETVTVPVTETVTASGEVQTVTETATQTETATVTETAPPVTETVTQTVPAAVSTSNSSSESEGSSSAAASTSSASSPEGGAVSGASSNANGGVAGNGAVAPAAEAVGPIPAGADAGQHAPVSRSGLAIWGALLMVIGGAAGLGLGFRPRWRRGH